MKLKKRYSEKYNGKYNNTIYVGAKESSIADKKPGASFFRFDKRLLLTKEGEKRRSIWELPSCFKREEKYFSIKPINDKFEELENGNLKYTPKRGRGSQELYIGNKEKVVEWAKDLVRKCKIYR